MGLGELTNRGKQRMFHLGRNLRERYRECIWIRCQLKMFMQEVHHENKNILAPIISKLIGLIVWVMIRSKD